MDSIQNGPPLINGPNPVTGRPCVHLTLTGCNREQPLIGSGSHPLPSPAPAFNGGLGNLHLPVRGLKPKPINRDQKVNQSRSHLLIGFDRRNLSSGGRALSDRHHVAGELDHEVGGGGHLQGDAAEIAVGGDEGDQRR